MDYIWTKYDTANTYEIDTDRLEENPYQEIYSNSKGKVSVNPWHRFSDIFQPLFSIADTQTAANINCVTNLIFHYLAQLDRLCGVSTPVLEAERLRHEIKIGVYGKQAQHLFGRLSSEEQQCLTLWLRKQDLSKNRHLYFREALTSLFPTSEIYFYEQEKIFLINMPQKGNESDKEKLELLEILFLEATAQKPRIFWQYHFGVIGHPATMRIDEIAIY